MGIFNFAHNGVHHSTGTEAVTHDASDSTMWIILGSVVMATILYTLTRLLSRRQVEEKATNQVHDL